MGHTGATSDRSPQKIYRLDSLPRNNLNRNKRDPKDPYDVMLSGDASEERILPPNRIRKTYDVDVHLED